MFLLILPIIFIASSVGGKECPQVYQRYSTNHSYCKPKNPKCEITLSGVKDEDKKIILDLHNQFRSQVATGNLTITKGFPQAANMMQMVWDKELASVAQNWVEQCVSENDCYECRRVGNFAVGQNMVAKTLTCSGPRCSNLTNNETERGWTGVIKDFIKQSQLLGYGLFDLYRFQPDFSIISQMIWAKTWRLGCGFVEFKVPEGFLQLYACNYGPSGNVEDNSIYKRGTPCSDCPENSHCDISSGKDSYKGLCKMKEGEVPLYKPKSGWLFYCDFRNLEGDCEIKTKSKNWTLTKAFEGYHLEVILKGGETAELVMKKKIHQKQLCFNIKHRMGPTVAGKKKDMKAEVILHMTASNKTMPLKYPLAQIEDYLEFFNTIFSVSTLEARDYEISIRVSVPSGSPAQFFDVASIKSESGSCGN